jgi:hypothetical protein
MDTGVRVRGAHRHRHTHAPEASNGRYAVHCWHERGHEKVRREPARCQSRNVSLCACMGMYSPCMPSYDIVWSHVDGNLVSGRPCVSVCMHTCTVCKYVHARTTTCTRHLGAAASACARPAWLALRHVGNALCRADRPITPPQSRPPSHPPPPSSVSGTHTYMGTYTHAHICPLWPMKSQGAAAPADRETLRAGAGPCARRPSAAAPPVQKSQAATHTGTDPASARIP